MGRYRLSHIALLLVVAGVAAATCGVSPALEQLQQRVAELEAESDAQFVVVDSLGAQVGELLGPVGDDVEVLFDFGDSRRVTGQRPDPGNPLLSRSLKVVAVVGLEPTTYGL
jgi:hypothetical protein